MAIKGSLREAGLADVLQLLSFGKKTGCLSVTDRRNFGKVFFQNGRVIHAFLVGRENPVAEHLVKSGKVNQADLDGAKSRKSLGGATIPPELVLVEGGVLSKEALREACAEVVKDSVYRLLSWKSGEFSFDPGKLPADGDGRLVDTISLVVQDLLLEGSRRIDEWRVIEDIVGGRDTVLECVAELEEVKLKQRLTEEEMSVLSLVNGVRDVNCIAGLSGLDDLRTCKILAKFASSAVLRVTDKKFRGQFRGGSSLNEHRNLAVAFFSGKMYEEASREYQEALKIDPEQSEMRFYLGLSLFHQGLVEKALQEYRRALKSDESNPKILNNMGIALEKLGKLDDAITCYQQAVEKDPEYAKAYANLGYAYYKRGGKDDRQAATECFLRAIELDAELSIAHYYLGMIYLRRGQYSDAVQKFEKASELDPKNPGVRLRLGGAYRARRMYQQAIEAYQEAIRLSPESETSYKELGELYYATGAHPEAVECFKKALELNERQSDVRFKLGNIYLKQNMTELAIEQWEKALELDPENQILKTNLAVAKRELRSPTGQSS